MVNYQKHEHVQKAFDYDDNDVDDNNDVGDDINDIDRGLLLSMVNKWLLIKVNKG